jgi:hypothetical protein
VQFVAFSSFAPGSTSRIKTFFCGNSNEMNQLKFQLPLYSSDTLSFPPFSGKKMTYGLVFFWQYKFR